MKTNHFMIFIILTFFGAMFVLKAILQVLIYTRPCMINHIWGLKQL